MSVTPVIAIQSTSADKYAVHGSRKALIPINLLVDDRETCIGQFPLEEGQVRHYGDVRSFIQQQCMGAMVANQPGLASKQLAPESADGPVPPPRIGFTDAPIRSPSMSKKRTSEFKVDFYMKEECDEEDIEIRMIPRIDEGEIEVPMSCVKILVLLGDGGAGRRRSSTASQEIHNLIATNRYLFMHPRDFPWAFVGSVIVHATFVFTLGGLSGALFMYLAGMYVKFNWETGVYKGESSDGNWEAFFLSSSVFYFVLVALPLMWSAAMVGKSVLKFVNGWVQIGPVKVPVPGPVGYATFFYILWMFTWSPLLYNTTGFVFYAFAGFSSVTVPVASIKLTHGRKSNFRTQLVKICSVYFMSIFSVNFLFSSQLGRLETECVEGCELTFLLITVLIFPAYKELFYAIIRMTAYRLHGHVENSDLALYTMFQIYMGWFGRFLFTKFDSVGALIGAVLLNAVTELVLRQTSFARDKMIEQIFSSMRSRFACLSRLIEPHDADAKEQKAQQARLLISEMHSEYISILSAPWIIGLMYPLRMRYALGYGSLDEELKWDMLVLACVAQLLAELFVDAVCFKVEMLQGYPLREQWENRHKLFNHVAVLSTFAATNLFVTTFRRGPESVAPCESEYFCMCYNNVAKVYAVQAEFCLQWLQDTGNGTEYGLDPYAFPGLNGTVY